MIMLSKKILLAACGHLVLAVTFYLILYRLGIITSLPDERNVLKWDAEWFNSIRLNGYEFRDNAICNLAFFPLFPYFWKWTFLNGVGISIVNYSIFILSLVYLLKDEVISYIFLLFIFSTASFIFFALPYTESMFFLFATLILRGYQTNSRIMMIAGFLFASLVRSVALIFIPAIIICAFFSSKQQLSRALFKTALYNILACLTGLFISAFIQYHQTHKWLYFLKVQKIWGREWLLPSLPLTSTYPARTMSIDGTAFIIGVLAIYFCFKYVFVFFKKTFKSSSIVFEMDIMVLFSIICLAGITILDTCFTFKINSSSNIWSINRHIFCSPFYIIFLLWLYKSYKPGKLEQGFILLVILAGIYCTGLYLYPNLILSYFIFFLSICIFKYWPNYHLYLIPVYMFGLVMQILFYQDFLRDLWVG